MVQEVNSRENQKAIAETIPVIIGLSLKLPHIDNEEELLLACHLQKLRWIEMILLTIVD